MALRTTFSIALCNREASPRTPQFARRNIAAYVAVPRLRFEFRIFRHIQHHFIEKNRRGRHALLTILQPGQSQQTANEFVQAAGFEFNALEHASALRSGALPRQAERHIQARQGRS